jgi:hypothetical protein
MGPLDVLGPMREMEVFIEALELKRAVFRGDHASNWLVLKGTLGADRERLLDELRAALAAPRPRRCGPLGRGGRKELL